MSEREERDLCAIYLSRMKRDDEIIVGRHRFRVERATGVTVYITKGKGQKLYKLDVTSLTPCTITIREVWPGSGDIKQGVAPVAIIDNATIRRGA